MQHVPPPPPPTTAAPGGSWLGRNWLWALPVGCLGVVLLLVGFVVGVLLLAMASLRSTDLYREALARAESDPRVAAALGAPIEAGLWVQGSIEIEGMRGEGELSIPLRGARGSGSLVVEARFDAGRWIYQRLAVDVDGAEPIDLLAVDGP
jgi:hypothetical protein